MCGRFTLTVSPETVQTSFNLTSVPEILSPRYNVAPSQSIAVITNENVSSLDFYRWGLVPSWAKDASMGNKMINARGETVHEKPAFRSAFRRRRCLILADGFYEWQKQNTVKVPMYIHVEEHRPFAFAGLWEIWRGEGGEVIRSCTILTTTPNSLMASIHERMPVILSLEDYDTWLAPDEQPIDRLMKLVKPYDPAKMAAYPVSKLVNKPSYDSPELIQPVA